MPLGTLYKHTMEWAGDTHIFTKTYIAFTIVLVMAPVFFSSSDQELIKIYASLRIEQGIALTNF